MSLAKSRVNVRKLKEIEMKKYSRELIPSDDGIFLIFKLVLKENWLYWRYFKIGWRLEVCHMTCSHLGAFIYGVDSEDYDDLQRDHSGKVELPMIIDRKN